MAEVIITESLIREINKTFKGESPKIFDHLLSLEKNPKKGKPLGHIGTIVVKELKYNSYRFYFLVSGHEVKFLKVEELEHLVIKFVRMSDKRHQQRTIDEIKDVLRTLGEEGFK